ATIGTAASVAPTQPSAPTVAAISLLRALAMASHQAPPLARTAATTPGLAPPSAAAARTATWPRRTARITVDPPPPPAASTGVARPPPRATAQPMGRPAARSAAGETMASTEANGCWSLLRKTVAGAKENLRDAAAIPFGTHSSSRAGDGVKDERSSMDATRTAQPDT